MTRAEDLVDELLEGGALVDEGGFSIDPDHARAKLRHALPDPDAYVVAWVRAGLLRGATRVVIEPGWTRTRVSFDGRALRDEELRELSSFCTLADDQPGDAASRRALTQGIQAGFTPRLEHAYTLVHGGRGPGLRARVLRSVDGRVSGLEVEPGGSRPIDAAGDTRAPGFTTVLELEIPRTLARLREVLVLATGEHRWARHTLRFADPVEIRLAGHAEPLSGPLTLPRADRYVDLAAVGVQGFAGSRADKPARKLAVVVGGIKVAVAPLPTELIHVDEAIVRDDALELDASGLAVVTDARWEALLDRLREADRRWAELDPAQPQDRGPAIELEVLRERLAPPWEVTGHWPNFVALFATILLPVVVLGAFGILAQAALLLVYGVPLAAIGKGLLDQRELNRSNLGAHLPSVLTLGSALVFGVGSAVTLTRLVAWLVYWAWSP